MKGLFRRPAFLIAAAWAILVAAPAGVREVMPPDEPRFALVAREMRERVAAGDPWSLVVPHLAGRVYTDKPPVLFWGINAAALPLGGVNEFAARVPSILAALATLLLTARAGRRLLGSEPAGLAAALVLLTTSEFFQRAQWCSTDMTLTALATAGGLAWSEAAFSARGAALGAERGAAPVGGRGPGMFDAPGRPRLLAALGWVAVAFAVLTKGPVGLIWALLWPVCEAAARRSFRPLRVILSPAGIALFLIIGGGWLALAESSSPGFVSAVLWHQSVERYVNAWNNVQPFWFYLYQFPLDFLPWSLVLPAGALLAWRRGGDSGAGASTSARTGAVAIRASALLLAAGLIFFSTSSGKRGVYLLPGFPAAAILVVSLLTSARARGAAFARTGAEAGSEPRTRAGTGAGTAAAAVRGLAEGPSMRRLPGTIFLLLGAAILFAGAAWAWRALGAGAASGVAIGGLALVLASLSARRRFDSGDGAGGARMLAEGLVPLFFIAATLGATLANDHQGAARFGRLVADTVPPGEPIAIERGKFELILYYARRGGFQFQRSKQLADRIQSGDARFAIVESESWEAALGERRLGRLEAVAEGRISDTGYVIAKEVHP